MGPAALHDEKEHCERDGDSVTSRPPRLEARRRLGCRTANELGAPAASSRPEPLPGHEPASAGKGYEDGKRSFCGIDVAKHRLDVMVLPEELTPIVTGVDISRLRFCGDQMTCTPNFLA